MTTETARQHLQAADRDLNAAVELLVTKPSNAGQLQAQLQAAADSLKKVYENRSSFKRTPSMAPLVQSIRARVARVQLLLDAAATFYCGTMSAAMSHSYCPYTPTGELSRRTEGNCFKVEA